MKYDDKNLIMGAVLNIFFTPQYSDLRPPLAAASFSALSAIYREPIRESQGKGAKRARERKKT